MDKSPLIFVCVKQPGRLVFDYATAVQTWAIFFAAKCFL